MAKLSAIVIAAILSAVLLALIFYSYFFSVDSQQVVKAAISSSFDDIENDAGSLLAAGRNPFSYQAALAETNRIRRLVYQHDNKKRNNSSSRSGRVRPAPHHFILTYIDSTAAQYRGMKHAAAIRGCYAKLHGYTLVVFTERDMRDYLPDKNASLRHILSSVVSPAPPAAPSSIHNNNNYNNKSNNNSGGSKQPAAITPEKAEQLKRNLNWRFTLGSFWSKHHLLTKALRTLPRSTRDFLWWIDADTVITLPSLSLERVVERVVRRRYVIFKQRELEKQQVFGTRLRLNYSYDFETGPFGELSDDEDVVVDPSSNKRPQQQSSQEASSTSNPPAAAGVAAASENDALAVTPFRVDKFFELLRVKERSRVIRLLPRIIVSDSTNFINNGVIGMRATGWTQRFLKAWQKDYYSFGTKYYLDNGPFVHAVLRELAKSRSVPYADECTPKTMFAKKKAQQAANPPPRGGGGSLRAALNRKSGGSGTPNVSVSLEEFIACYRNVLRTRLVPPVTQHNLNRNMLDELVSRCPESHQRSRDAGDHAYFGTKRQLGGPSFAPRLSQRRVQEKINTQFGFTPAAADAAATGGAMPPEALRSNLRYETHWAYGWLLNDDPFVAGDCRINNGIGPLWKPTGEWHGDTSLLMHAAGYRVPAQRSAMLERYARHYEKRFPSRCKLPRPSPPTPAPKPTDKPTSTPPPAKQN